MLDKFRQHLTLLLAGTTSLILTLIFLVIWMYQSHLHQAQLESLFQNYVLELSNKLEADSRFSDSWIAAMEADSRLIIHIEENGHPLFFPGSWTPATDRDTLIEKVKGQAKGQQMDLSQPLLTSSLKKTSLLFIRGKHGDMYQAAALQVAGQDVSKSLVLLQDITFLKYEKIRQGCFYLLLDLLGFAALYLVSRLILKRAMQPMADYQQQQTDFIAAASHELRSPLSVIQTSASVIEEDPGQAASMSRLIRQECSRAGKLIHDLLLLASSDSGMSPRKLEPVEADTLLLRLFESYEPLCRQKGISLLLHMPDDLMPPVLSDFAYLYQILSILLENAMAYGIPPSGEKPVIELGARVFGKHILLSVADHGPGISEEKKQDIFRRFYRSDPSRSKKEHFGLGLSIASELSKQLRCQITVQDTPKGGSTFLVKLKITEPAANALL